MSDPNKKAFTLLFSVELWERWAYYGIQALLTLYFVQSMGYPDKVAYSIFAAFAALFYLFTIIGGIISDKFLGPKATLTLGGVILVVGYFWLSFNLSGEIYSPLALIVVGGGIFKPSPSRIIGGMFQNEHKKLQSAFTLFYMSINIGALGSKTISPIIAQHYGYNLAFAVSFIGMSIALLNYLFSLFSLKHVTIKPAVKYSLLNMCLLALAILGLIVGSRYAIKFYYIADYAILTGGIGALIYAIIEGYNLDNSEKRKMFLAIILIIQAIVYYIIYFQIPMTMTLFAARNTTSTFLGFSVNPATYQLLNPLWIILLGPIFAKIYKHTDGSFAAKFSIGTIFCGFGILILPIVTHCFANHGIVNGNWFILAYFFQVIGELLISALGLAMISTYIPRKMIGFALGSWYMCSSIGSILAGKLAVFTDIPKNITNPLETLPIYSHYFLILGVSAILIGIIFSFMLPCLKKLAAD